MCDLVGSPAGRPGHCAPRYPCQVGTVVVGVAVVDVVVVAVVDVVVVAVVDVVVAFVDVVSLAVVDVGGVAVVDVVVVDEGDVVIGSVVVVNSGGGCVFVAVVSSNAPFDPARWQERPMTLVTRLIKKRLSLL